jgi:hypothetical protein
MIALIPTQIDGDLGFERGIDRLGQIVPQQDIFRRNSRVRFELKNPVSVGPLQREQRTRCRLDALVERRCRHGRLRLC